MEMAESWLDRTLWRAAGLPIIGAVANSILEARGIVPFEHNVAENADDVAERTAAIEALRETERVWSQQEIDRDDMEYEEYQEVYGRPDPIRDAAEAYADVAGDATLSWRLAEEDALEILDDVKRQAHERAFARGRVSGLPEMTEGRDDEILRLYREAISQNVDPLRRLQIDTDGPSAQQRAEDAFYKRGQKPLTPEEALASNEPDLLAHDPLAPVVSRGRDTGR